MSIAESIRKSTREELGLTVSIGVSYNKIFAKLGSDMKKPDAITEITAENFKNKVWPLPANEMIYVGPATTKRLNANRAIELGFADDVLTDEKKVVDDFAAFSFSRKAVSNSLLNKLMRSRAAAEPAPTQPEKTGRSVDALYERLDIMRHN